MPKRRALLLIISVSIPLVSEAVANTELKPQKIPIQLRGGKVIDEKHGILEGSLKSSRSLQMNNKACVSNVWHIDFTKMTGSWCTNSLGYPDSFNDDPKMLQPSAQECCANIFPGESCQVNKVCETEDNTSDSASAASVPTPKPTGRPSPWPSYKPTSTMVSCILWHLKL